MSLVFKQSAITRVLIALLIWNSAIGPFAYADEPAPTPDPVAQAINESAEREDKAIDDAAKDLPQNEETAKLITAEHEWNQANKAAALALNKKGFIPWFMNLPAQDKIRQIFGFGKGATRAGIGASAIDWSSGNPWVIGAGAALTLANFNFEYWVTTKEMKIAESFQNFPLNAAPLPPKKRYWTEFIQASVWGSAVFWAGVPAAMATLGKLSAWEDPHRNWPSLAATGISFAVGLGSSAVYQFGFEGTNHFVKTGRLSKAIRSIFYALTGLFGFVGGVVLANPDFHAFTVYHVMAPVWGSYLLAGTLAWFSKLRTAEQKEKPAAPASCPRDLSKLSR